MFNWSKSNKKAYKVQSEASKDKNNPPTPLFATFKAL